MAYKEFDWEKAKEVNSPAKLQWLWENHKREVTASEYIEEVKKLKSYSVSAKPNKRYAPSKLLQQYKSLKEKFGFFTGELN